MISVSGRDWQKVDVNAKIAKKIQQEFNLSQILSGLKNVSNQSEDLKQAIINLKSSSESLNSSSIKVASALISLLLKLDLNSGIPRVLLPSVITITNS